MNNKVLNRLLFVTLLLLLFVGDGKRSIVDVVGMAGVLALCTVTILTKKIRFPSVGIIFWWAVLLLYLLIRLPFSDSVAYSLYATMRYVIAFVVFIFFADSNITPRLFSRAVIGFALFALALSLIVLFVPSVRTLMPEMSLLSNVYGHHHIAYLLIFALPFAVRGAFAKKSWTYGVISTIFFVSLVLTRARGAWFVAAFYVAYILFRDRFAFRKRYFALGAGLATIFLVMFAVTTAAPKLIKKTDFTSARLGYWRQAAAAFTDNPAFGTGLGTFYLSSLKYQSQPQSYSWLAHSFPIQTASETGITGLIGFIGLFWAIGRNIKRKLTTEEIPLLEAVVLTAIYSIFEINLDYLVIWILMWAALGLLVSQNKKNSPAAQRLLYGSMGCIGLFYVVFVGTETVQFFTKNQVFLQPYNTQRTLAFLDSRMGGLPLSQKQLDTILWFHRKNPEVLAAVGFFEKAAARDPQRVEYLEKYINLLLEQNDQAGAARALKLDTGLSPLLTKELFADVGKPMTNEEYFAKLYYFLGLAVLEKDPQQTRILWTRARDSVPDWGYFHVELAGLESKVFHDEEKAKSILEKCRQYLYAKSQCGQTPVSDLGYPGYQKSNIRAIPQVLY